MKYKKQMNKLNINMKKVEKYLFQQGREDRKILFESSLTPEQLEKFKIAADILHESEIKCSKFEQRDGI